MAPVVVVPPEDSLSYRGDSMDGDSNDEGTVTESLNGETKPDPAKLAQTAIRSINCKKILFETGQIENYPKDSKFVFYLDKSKQSIANK